MTVQPSYGRFKLLDRPIAVPGNCAVCGTTEHPVVDFDLNIDFYGAFYLCVRCLAEGASVIDMVHGKEVDELTKKAEQSLGAQLLQRSLVAVTDEWFYSLFNAVGDISSARYYPDVHSDDQTDDSTGEEVSDDSAGSTAGELNAEQPDASDIGQDSEPVSEPRPAGISTDSSNEQRVEHFVL